VLKTKQGIAMKNEDREMTQEEIDDYKKASDSFFYFDESLISEAIIRAQYENASNKEEHRENVKMLRYLESLKNK
jgi:hypothetical protein